MARVGSFSKGRSLAILSGGAVAIALAAAAHIALAPVVSSLVFAPAWAAEKDDAPAKDTKKRHRKSRLTYDESEETSDRRSLLLATGEDRTVDLDFDVNVTANGIAIGNPQIVATTLVKIGEKRQIVFKPLKAGSTTVTVRDSDGVIRLIFNVRVAGSNPLTLASEIRSLLRDVEGIDVRVVGQKVVIEGEVLVPTDYGRLSYVASDYGSGSVMNLATVSPLGMLVIAKKIQEDVKAFAPNVSTRVVNGVIFLEGSVDSLDKAKRADDIAGIYLPEVRAPQLIDLDRNAQHSQPRRLIKNFIVVEPAPPKKQEKLVRVTVHFVELSKDYLKSFAFKWQPGFTSDPQIAIGQGTTGGTATAGASFSATLSSLLPKLQSAQSAGYARILKTGTIIVRSGQPAQLEESTSIPYAVTGANNQVQSASAQVGLKVGVTPAILGQSEDISMELKVSQLAYVGQTTQGTPITSAHNIDTKLYVKSGESAAVGAVNSSDVSTNFNKTDPKSGSFQASSDGAQTDALFTLLRSKDYQKKKSQFVIFVTPQIVENASEGTEDLKKNFRVRVK